MGKIHKNLAELIGNTPLLEVSNIEKEEGLKAHLVVKPELFNPGGSVKDRIALSMITVAEKEGKLAPGATIIEPTSGNTGVGLAWVSAIKGYHLILTMPETMSIERRKLLKAYGAELVLTPGTEGMKGAIAKANELNASIPGSIILQQFDNPANPAIHLFSTAPAEYYAYKHFCQFVMPGTEMIAYAGRDLSSTPVVVFRNGQQFIITSGNFTDSSAVLSVKVNNKYLNITATPHSFNTYVIG